MSLASRAVKTVAPGIFKAYDVRGLFPDEIDAEVAYRIGRAFVRVLADEEGTAPGNMRVGLGRDMRLTAPELSARYADGMRDEGADVLDVGQVGTEMLYFTVGSRDLNGGLMCTASHNPKAYTGAKLVKRGAIPLSGDSGIAELRRIVEEGDPGEPASPPGEVTNEDVAPDFEAAAMAFIDPSNVGAMRVVVDGGNGMAGPMGGPLPHRPPIHQIQTHWTPHGHIPHPQPHPPPPQNPTLVMKKGLSAG